jgi:catechol O-methyltransferase
MLIAIYTLIELTIAIIVASEAQSPRTIKQATLTPVKRVLVSSVLSGLLEVTASASPDFVQEIRSYLDATAKEGDFDSVCRAMDRFAIVYPMYALSPKKVKFLQSEVMGSQPERILEIGTFFGYSAIHMARVMSKTARLTCIEGNNENAKVAKAVLRKAFGKDSDVLSRVTVINSLSTNVLQKGNLEEITGSNQKLIDFVFLDHDKSFLLPDLITLETRSWLNSSFCKVVADNVIFPGAPTYLEYVNARSTLTSSDRVDGADITNSHWRTTLAPFPFERVGFETQFQERSDAMAISVSVVEEKRQG